MSPRPYLVHAVAADEPLRVEEEGGEGVVGPGGLGDGVRGGCEDMGETRDTGLASHPGEGQ